MVDLSNSQTVKLPEAILYLYTCIYIYLSIYHKLSINPSSPAELNQLSRHMGDPLVAMRNLRMPRGPADVEGPNEIAKLAEIILGQYSRQSYSY